MLHPRREKRTDDGSGTDVLFSVLKQVFSRTAKFSSLIHVISFINVALHIISTIVSVYLGGEKRLALQGLTPIASNTAGPRNVAIVVASSNRGERRPLSSPARSLT